MKNNSFLKLSLFLLPSSLLFSDSIDDTLLREMKLFKIQNQPHNQMDTKKEIVDKHTLNRSQVSLTQRNKIKEIMELYVLNEYKSSLYLLNKMEETNNIKNFKTMLKAFVKIDDDKDIRAEIDYLLTFPFTDYFFISELHKKLLNNNKIKEAIYFLKNTKVSPFNFLDELDFSEKQIKKLGISEYFTNLDINIQKEIKLAEAYEEVDMLLDSYETYKQNNPNNKYSAQINELKKKINYRIKLYSNYEENNDNIRHIMKKYDNVKLFKIYKERINVKK